MAEQASKQDLETYHGSCHCKAFEYSVKLPKLETASVCNCSYCAKHGYVWAFIDSKDDLVVEKGSDVLKEYRFANKTLAYKFCPTCGVSPLAEMVSGGSAIGINILTLEDVDTEALKISTYDGASMGTPYAAPNGPKPASPDAPTRTYGGSCHCGKVTYEVTTKPLDELEATKCNCSICARRAYLWTYPPKSDVTINGLENTTCYRFATGFAGHSFCSTCAVPLFNQLRDPDPNSKRASIQPVNLRVLNGVDIGQLKIKKVDGKSFDPSKGESKDQN